MTECDVLIRNGCIYDGRGGEPFAGCVGITGDTIVYVGPEAGATGRTEIDAGGLAVAPGFINMLSWANVSLIADGRSQSDIRQGVTLEVLGEGRSMGPLNDAMKADMKADQDAIRYDIEWTSLGEYLEWLVARGISPNVASFVGAATVRIHVLGYDDVDPTPEQLDAMCALVRQAMEEGAMGVSSALIYNPGVYAETAELIALARVAGDHGGMYISHMRSEGDALLEAFDELATIARKAGVRAEIYHLKASGRQNWRKLDALSRRIEAARDAGLDITADMYTYNASSTGLNAIMPSWVQEGGHEAWVARLKDPAVRHRLKAQMNIASPDWDNGYLSSGGPDNILLIGFRNPELKPLTGKTLAEVAAMRGTSPEETAMDLVIEDNSRVGAVFFSMSEDNVRRKVQLPWVSFCSDSGSLAPEGVFLERSAHPRAYGSFARLLGRYVRDEKLVSLPEAIRRLTHLPATNLRLERRGRLAPGYFADIVVFDPATITDHATFAEPHQYATGVKHVFVNGVQVLCDGEHTGALPGRVVRGPGWAGRRGASQGG
jgi:N-acyl-D-amino-acid deacylase